MYTEPLTPYPHTATPTAAPPPLPQPQCTERHTHTMAHTERGVAAEVGFAGVAGDADIGDAVDIVGVEKRAIHHGVGEIERVACVAVHGDIECNHGAVTLESHLHTTRARKQLCHTHASTYTHTQSV